MITCKPLRPLSWSYYLEGDGHEAIWKKRIAQERGRFLIDDVLYEVHKGGVGSGYWTLTSDDDVRARAKKVSLFRRKFDLESPMGRLDLGPVNALTRSFYLGEPQGDLVAIISPKRFLSRRAEIEFHVRDYDFPTIVFSFWLTVILWRRQARMAGGA